MKNHEEVKLANLFTTLNLLSGIISIFFSIYGQFTQAAFAIFAAIIFDYFDGKLARRANKVTAFGGEYDSSADLISFGVAPLILGFMHLSTTFAISAYFLNIIAGAFRLSRYNILPKTPYFVGMPISIHAVIIAIITIIHVPLQYWPPIYILTAILMVSPLRFPKK